MPANPGAELSKASPIPSELPTNFSDMSQIGMEQRYSDLSKGTSAMQMATSPMSSTISGAWNFLPSEQTAPIVMPVFAPQSPQHDAPSDSSATFELDYTYPVLHGSNYYSSSYSDGGASKNQSQQTTAVPLEQASDLSDWACGNSSGIYPSIIPSQYLM